MALPASNRPSVACCVIRDDILYGDETVGAGRTGALPLSWGACRTASTTGGGGGACSRTAPSRHRYAEYIHVSCVRLVRRENILTFSASDWSGVTGWRANHTD
eukprot:681584-Prorocentrum_minimum.AAC.1